jgi:hypothetical protein
VARILYALSVVALIGGTAWAATGVKGARGYSSGGLGIVLLTALQR